MKTIRVCVKMSGWVYQEMEVSDDFNGTDNEANQILDDFDFSDASDLNDSIEWKLRYSDEITIVDVESGDTIWTDVSEFNPADLFEE